MCCDTLKKENKDSFLLLIHDEEENQNSHQLRLLIIGDSTVKRLLSHSMIASQFKEVAVLAYPGKKINSVLAMFKNDPTVLQEAYFKCNFNN